MEQAYVHDWVAFLAVQIQDGEVKSGGRLPFPLPICMMCCIVRSVGCAKLGLLSAESAHFNFHF